MSGSVFQMVDVGKKEITPRRASAQGTIQMNSEAFALVKERRLPKGDALVLAEVAGITAAKRACEILPLCHPLMLNQVNVRATLDENACAVTVQCEVSANAKTGPEMEALSGVMGALLAVYDLTKGVDPALSISDIHLNFKVGGKSGFWVHPKAKAAAELNRNDGHSLAQELRPLGGIDCAVVTISDRVSQGKASDQSGKELVSLLQELGANVVEQALIPDDKSKFISLIKQYALSQEIKLIVTTGGTGLSPRDVTPEALVEVCDKLIPGIGELLRSRGMQYTERAVLSRATAGLLGKSIVIALPGSPRAVREGFSMIKDILTHAIHIAQGGAHDES